eukprot:5273731-Prymnesium_polylepis.2
MIAPNDCPDGSTNLWEMPSVCTPTLRDPLDTSNFQMNAQARFHADRMRLLLEDDQLSDEAEDSTQ